MKTTVFLRQIAEDPVKISRFTADEIQLHIRGTERLLFEEIIDNPRRRTSLELAYDALTMISHEKNLGYSESDVISTIARSWPYMVGK